ncbi:MAG: hypothetical protein NT069_33475, partial [Planctomycetota bacterium]|nr:hypothetical protein [Planctomycetota bacterium]
MISTDVNLGSGINSGTEKTTLLTHSGRTMALGTATGDWSLSPGEINNLVMAELEIGDANNGNITVGAVSRTQSSHIGLVRLNATGDDRRVEFTGGSSTFQSLNVLADAGIGVSSNLSTDTGDLTLNGDSDAMPDGDDRITFANGVVVSAGGAMRLGAATGGLLGAGTLQLLANSGVTLDDRLATAGDLTINADRNNDGVGPLVAKGRVDVAGQSALLISSDIDLQGAFSVAGTATLRSSGNRTMGIGNAAGDWRFDLAEFQRTTAVTLVFGGFSNGNVAVDGVTSTASSGVQRVEILALADTRAVTFRGTGSSFRELSVSASDGIFMQAGAKTTAGPLSFFADTDLDCVGSFVLSPGATIDSTDHEISITAADVDLSGLLTAGDGNVFLNPSCPPEVIGIGDTTADFSLSQAEFGHIVGTSGLVTVGSLANTGGMRIGTTESVALGGLRTALITGGDATVNGQLSSTTAPLLLTAGKNIRFAPTGALVSTNGPITLTADALPGNLGGGFFMDAGSKIDGGTGDVTVDADGNVELAKILTTHTASILSRSGAITHVGPSGEANITADTATLRAARGIGDTSSPLETEVRLLAAENTTSGRIEIRGVASTTLILGPTGGLSGVRNLAGEVHVVNRGDLIIQNVESPTLVSLESTAGGIFDGQAGGAADIRATSLALRSSSGIGTAVDALEIDVRRVAAENSTAGRIEIRGVSTESLTLGAVNGLDGVRNLAGDTHVVTAGTLIVEYVESFSQVSLQTLAGGILDGKAGDSPDIVANELVLRSTGGIGLATDALETSVRRLAAENTTTGGIEIRGVSSDSLTLGSAGGLPGVRNLVGDTHVTTLGDLIIENVEAPMQVSLQSLTGGIFDGHSGAGPDIRANELVLRAAGGIGTSGDALEIAVRRLAADNTTTGGIDIHGVSTDSLTLGAAGGLPGVQNRAGDLRVVTEGTLIVESAGTFGHEIEFTAADVDIPGHLSAGAGNVFLNPLQAAESIGIGDISADFTLSRDDLNHITGTSGLVTVGSLANQGGIHIATSETVDIGGLRTSLITGADTRVDGLLSSTTAPLLLTAGRNVTFGAAGALVSTQGPISITADALPGSSGSVIQMATGSRIDAGTGDVLLRTDGDITVASVKTTNSAAIRTDSGAIHRAGPDGVPNVTGGRVALVAQQGIGDPVAPLQVDAGRLAAENFASGEIVVRGVSANPLTLGSAGEGSGEFPGVRNHAGNVRVVSAGPLVIENVESSQTVALQSLAGGIVDGKGGDGIDIRAKSLQMRSSGGIGSTGPNGRLETAVDLVAATNTDGGEIDIFNNTGAGLTVGIVEGLVGLTNSGGGIAVDNAKKLSILSQVKTIGGGNISLTSDGDAKTGSDLLTMAPILAVGGNGSVFLQAGKNLVLRDSGAEFDIEVENAGQIIGVAQQMVDFGSNVQLKAGPGFVPPDAVVPGLGFVPGLGDGPVYGVVPVLSPSLLYVDAPLVHNAIATVSGQIGDPHGHGYIVVIDWHDGTKTQQFFGDPTSFQFQHFYNSNPDKTDSSKPIPITVTLYDFFQISLTGLHQPAVTTPLSLHETLTVGNGFQTVLTFAEIPGEGLAFPVFVLPVNLPQVTLPAPVT